MQEVKSVFGLHIRVRIAYEPIPKSTQCIPKIEENNDVRQVHTFFHQKREIMWNMISKGAQMDAFISGVGPLGTPLAPQYICLYEKCHQSAPKVTRRCQKGLQKWCKSDKSDPKIDEQTLLFHDWAY